MAIKIEAYYENLYQKAKENRRKNQFGCSTLKLGELEMADKTLDT
jgi:type IV pilus biogenesis protein CpaD/CtpE